MTILSNIQHKTEHEDKNRSLKHLMRVQIMKERETFDEYEYQYANNKIYQNTLEIINSICPELLRNADTEFSKNNLGLYWPLKGEPDLLKFVIIANNRTSLPKTLERQMVFIKYNCGDHVTQGLVSSIYQPTSTSEVHPCIIIVPGLAFTVNGYRLGFGKGYYDKYLDRIRSTDNAAITIGVCFHKWLIENIPCGIFDRQLNYVVTDQYIIKI